jgi:phage terminase Nu1 subunit (DNA packaging protein)
MTAKDAVAILEAELAKLKIARDRCMPVSDARKKLDTQVWALDIAIDLTKTR